MVRTWWWTVVIAFAAAAVLIAVFAVPRLQSFTLENGITDCGTYSSEQRFSCYWVAIEKNWDGKDLHGYITGLMNIDVPFEDDEKTYSVFGTNCHTFYHAVGDFAAMNGRDVPLEELMSWGTSRCTAGYLMGLYKRYSYESNAPPELAKEFLENCYPESRGQCAHEIGHSWHDKYIMPILATVDAITKREFGVVVDTHHPASTTAADLNKPFEECRTYLPEEWWWDCYSGIGHNMFEFGEFDPEGYANEVRQCDSVELQEDRNQCYDQYIWRYAVTLVGPLFLRSEFSEAADRCASIADSVPAAHAESALQNCYSGIGGGIGLYVDSEYPAALLDTFDEKEVRAALNNYVRLCEEAPPGKYQDWCLMGLMRTHFRDLYTTYRIQYPPLENLIDRARDLRANVS